MDRFDIRVVYQSYECRAVNIALLMLRHCSPLRNLTILKMQRQLGKEAHGLNANSVCQNLILVDLDDIWRTLVVNHANFLAAC